MFKLETERLVLRDWRESDFGDCHEYAQMPDVSRYQLWGPNSEADTRQFIQSAMPLVNEERRLVYEMALELCSTQVVIGGIGLFIRSLTHQNAEMGYTLNPKYHNRGYATEAARAVLQFGFEGLGLKRIYSTCRPENIASIRVLQKCGMLQEGVMRSCHFMKGQWVDSLLFAQVR